MQDQVNATTGPNRVPWNKGKLTGAKPPLRPKHVWSIRTKLQIEGRARDLAMFNLAIDSKLRGCDVVTLRVEDVAASGYTADRATVRQKKTGRPVRFELTPMFNRPEVATILIGGHRGQDRIEGSAQLPLGNFKGPPGRDIATDGRPDRWPLRRLDMPR